MELDYTKLNPGIRDIVRELREVHGMQTTDSGDGTNFANGMEGAIEERHVYIQVTVDTFFSEGRRLKGLYPEAHIEATWWPASDTAMLLFFPDGIIIPDGYEKIEE